MSDKPEIVSKVPEITPELLEKNEAEQKVWRERFALPKITGDAYAATVIESNFRILDSLDRQIPFARLKERRELEVRARQLRNDTAIWLASIGYFEAAALTTTIPDQNTLYSQYFQADLRDDAEWCEHPLFKYVDGQPSQVAYREMGFYSQNSGRRLSMMRCGTCGFRNAKDLPVELVRLSAHRAQAVTDGKDKAADLGTIISAK